ncbi:MAG TPA: ABC transporter permease subunit, partial [Isosphaeraceae bacterium]|nr:ABC transporter permease subunit [Isosphaeraceae bacterium]
MRWIVDAALAAALIAVLGWPALATVIEAARGAEEERRGGRLAAGEADNWRVPRPLVLAGRSAEVVGMALAIALPVGVPLALILFRTDAWGRRAVLGVLALAAFVPMPLHATAWLGAFGNAGRAQAFGLGPVLVGRLGAAVVHALAMIPWIVLLAGVGLRTVEPELEESALLDLPAWRVLGRVTLRRSLGTLAGAALAVAVLTAGDMTVTDLLQVRTYAEEAYVRFQLGQGPGAVAAVTVPPLLVFGMLLALTARGLLRADPARLASAAARGRVWRLGRRRVPLGGLVAATAAGLVAPPLCGLVWWAGRVGGTAPRWSVAGLVRTLREAGADAAGPLAEGLVWSAFGATATVILAWALAWLSRAPGPWRAITGATAALTLATPAPVAGMALILAYRSVPMVYNSPAMLVLADVLRTLPFALLILWPALRTIPPEHLEAAALDGLGPRAIARRVAIPLARGATVAAWGVAFVLALGELPASNLVAPPGHTPLAVVIWSSLHSGVESRLAGLALIMLAVVAASGILAAWALGRVEVR